MKQSRAQLSWTSGPLRLTRYDDAVAVGGSRRGTGSVLTADREPVEDSLLERGAGQNFGAAGAVRAQRRGVRAAKRVDGSTLYLGHLYSHFGHFLLEGLSKCWPLLDAGGRTAWDGVAFHIYGDEIVPGYALELLGALGVRPESITLIRDNIHFASLTVPQSSFVARRCVDRAYLETQSRVAERLAGPLPVAPKARTYLSRSGLSHAERLVLNEREVEDLFADCGFTIVHPQDLPLREQIATVRTSALIAGATGSALHGVVYAPGTSVLHLAADRINPNYTLLDKLAEASVTYLKCLRRTEAPPSIPAALAQEVVANGGHLVADVAAIHAALRTMDLAPTRVAVPRQEATTDHTDLFTASHISWAAKRGRFDVVFQEADAAGLWETRTVAIARELLKVAALAGKPHPKALALGEWLCREKPSAETLHHYGMCLTAAKKLGDAEKALRQALDLKPNSVACYRSLLAVLERRPFDWRKRAVARRLGFLLESPILQTMKPKDLESVWARLDAGDTNPLKGYEAVTQQPETKPARSETPAGYRQGGDAFYVDVLADIHRYFQPRQYMEIGVRRGKSIKLAGCPAVGVDPDPDIAGTLPATSKVVVSTSDDFFAGDTGAYLKRAPDLAFIDGMHLFEYVLRDFINTERLVTPGSIVVIDDIFPRQAEMAARERKTRLWAGDVWKIYECLRLYRPDLMLVGVNTDPTGLLIVIGLDPTNTVLSDRYDEIIARFPDDAEVPKSILDREGIVSSNAEAIPALLRFMHKVRDQGLSSSEIVREAKALMAAQAAA